MTQQDLASVLNISDKAVSKWETAKGYPDITLLEPLAKALDVSVLELLSGNDVTNTNGASNMLRSKLYVCPVCGNVIHSIGEVVVSCHGIALPALEAEDADESHEAEICCVEDEYYVTLHHEMSKAHFISFIAGVSDNGMDFVKLYPEGNAEARFKIGRTQWFYVCCNRHGLFRIRCPKHSTRNRT